MKIMHIGLLSHFTEGMSYQDNLLSEMNLLEGHEVVFITNTSKYLNGKLVECGEEDILLSNGLRLIRLSYDYIFNKFISNKIQKVKKLKHYLYEFNPDSIMYHGVCGYELMTVAKYVRNHPQVLFYVDSHEDFNNTAKSVVAKISYKIIHGHFIKKARKEIKKILYLSSETKFFLQNMYGIPDNELEFYPLGGIIQNSLAQEKAKRKLLEKYSLTADTVICAHSGKLDQLKRTKELLTAFSSVKTNKLFLIIFGSIPSEQKNIIEPLIAGDNRIVFEGWKNNVESIEILSGVDVYCQPGTQSATSQIALCCGCMEMVYPHESYKDFYKDNVMYIKTENDIRTAFQNIVDNYDLVLLYKNKSMIFATNNLSYELLAKRYTQ